MQLGAVDSSIVVLFVVLCVAVGLAGRRRAGRNLEEYFLGGRRLGWFAAGCSMAATTLAVDTPMAVAGLVGQEGIAGNWFWWHGAIGCAAAAFLFAPLWRRMEILTDNEMIEIRYWGPSAEILRAIRGFVDGFIRPAVVISLLSLLMGDLAGSMLGVPPGVGIVFFLGLAALYTTVSGFRGVVATDLLQLAAALAGTALFGWYAAGAIGGNAPLAERAAETIRGAVSGAGGFLPDTAGGRANDVRAFLPLHSVLTPFSWILVYVSVAWWARGNADGGNFLAQRAFAVRDRRHARLAFLWFGVIHFCLRPWPWIAVGLVGIVREPVKWLSGSRLDVELASVDLGLDLLPAGLRGLLAAALFGGFLSTVDTQLNCGAAYLVNDLWKRFLARGRPEEHYVRTARAATLVLLLVSLLLTVVLSNLVYVSIKSVWEFLLLAGGGIGGVMILRWYWWRVNAWSELSAIVGAPLFALVAVLIQTQLGPFAFLAFPYSLVWVVLLTTAAWIGTTLLTPPVPEVSLLRFYMRCRPGGPGWRRLAFRIPGYEEDGPGAMEFAWMAAAVAVLYAGLFGLGHVLLGSAGWGWLLLIGAIVGGGLVWWNWRAS